MTAKITFHPLGDADCTLIDLADGSKMLVDYANMRNAADASDKRIDLPEELKRNLRAANRKSFDVVCYTHLDNDHCCGSSDFFWFDHAVKYQGEGRIKIDELWVPAGAIIEPGLTDSARVIREEAKYRLKKGYGIRVFSRPGHLKSWLEANGLTLESRRHLITDAGEYVPGYDKNGPKKVEFFIHSPFAWRLDENYVVDRNEDSTVFQATFKEGSRETYALFMSDINSDSIDQIVQTTKKHGNDDRLLWDIFKIPHHCSYKAINVYEKGRDQTEPTDDVAWLCEDQGRDRAIMVSTSWPIPLKGTAEDKDVQPPHREAANYYRQVADNLDGTFKVTMETPSTSKPRPMTIEITDRGAMLLTVAATVGGAGSIISTPARAGDDDEE